MASDRYLEIIKRFLRAEMYFRSRTPAGPTERPDATDQQSPPANEQPQ